MVYWSLNVIYLIKLTMSVIPALRNFWVNVLSSFITLAPGQKS